MQLPGIPSLAYLAFLLVLLPWVAFRSARQLRPAAKTPAPAVSREAIWANAIVTQGVLFLAAWLVGQSFGYRVFVAPALTVRNLAAAVAALASCLALRSSLRVLRSEEERRKLVVYRLAPRTGREWAIWSVAVLFVGVAEETAYRGVGTSILWYTLGNGWIAAVICAVAFALAHWAQGWKSGVVILAIALVMQGLVAYTGTLVFAMIVHTIYDFVAGVLIARKARQLDLETAASGR